MSVSDQVDQGSGSDRSKTVYVAAQQFQVFSGSFLYVVLTSKRISMNFNKKGEYLSLWCIFVDPQWSKLYIQAQIQTHCFFK